MKMKINIHKLLIALAVGILAASSCKKEEEATVTPSLEGALTFHAPAFIKPGETVSMTPKGIEHPEGKGVGFYWKVSGEKSDTTRLENGLSPDGKESDGTFVYTFPDSLAVYTVTCYAFAEGYTGSSSSKYVTTVKPGLNGSLTNTGIRANDSHVDIDGQDYYYTKIGSLEWMRNNLGVRKGGAPYDNADIMSDVFGRFYNYEDAMTACPKGWRLPTENDWLALGTTINGKETSKYGIIEGVAAKLMADARFNGVDMWDYWPEVGPLTNNYGFAAIPAGYLNLGEKNESGEYPEAVSKGVYEYSVFWTADPVDGESGMAYYRYIVANQPDMFTSKGDMANFGASVRCVRDAR